MDPLHLIQKHYDPDSKAFKVLVAHSTLVRKKALEVARRIPEESPDLAFIEEAAMLHDIGITFTNAPDLGCHGDLPYICHGYKGCELLEQEGYPRHALVCERHTGVGLTVADIKNQHLPIPERDMTPKTVEEEIICFADKFFSKSPKWLGKTKTIEQIKASLARHGMDKVRIFERMCEKFKEPI